MFTSIYVTYLRVVRLPCAARLLEWFLVTHYHAYDVHLNYIFAAFYGHGIAMTITIIVALLVDFFFLPPLLMFLARKPSSQSIPGTDDNPQQPHSTPKSPLESL